MKFALLSLAASLAIVVPPSLLAPVREPAVEDPATTQYRITARYDPATGVVEGDQQVYWRNNTTAPTNELRFHMYWNGFAENSTWMRERARKGRRGGTHAWGSIEILRMTGPGGQDWTSRVEYIAPDDANPHDRTVARVKLDRSIAPGEDLALDLQFRGQAPGPWSRTGRAGDYIAAAHWFPKLGVLEVDGLGVAQWNCPQFHNLSEFFAEFGSYRVTLELPERYRGKIAASGVFVGESEAAEEGWHRQTFRADKVHEFAWFADSDFIVTRRTVDLESQREDPALEVWGDRLGIDDLEELVQPEVELEVFVQPDHAHLAERHLDAVERSLVWFGRAFGPYPYSGLRAVDPQNNAFGTAGMEYPTLISCGTRLFVPRGRHSPEGVTIHEVGHQWFYGLVATDEFEHGFLDEGFDVFAESNALQDLFGPDHTVSFFGPYQRRGTSRIPAVKGSPLLSLSRFARGDLLGFGPGRPARFLLEAPPLTHFDEPWDFPAIERNEWLGYAAADRIWRTTWTFGEREVYRMHTYRLAGLTLEAYRRVAGNKLAYRTLRRYAQRYRYGHPEPEDFIAVARELSEEPRPEDASAAPFSLDAGEYFEQVWTVPGFVDFAVRDVRCGKDDDAETSQEPSSWCRVLVDQRGPWRLPVEIELEYDDGRVETVVWDDRESWHAVERSSTAELIAVRVDPQRRWVFDRTFANNQWSVQPENESLLRVWLAAFHQMAQQMFTFGRLS